MDSPNTGRVPGIALLGGLLLAAAAATGAVAGDQAPQTKQAFAAHVRSALAAQGWTATAAAEGGVCYRPPAGMLEDARVEAGQAVSLANQLAEVLERQGWTARPAEDGSVVYEPPAADRAVAPPPDTHPSPSLAEQLRQTLETQGWSAQPAENGGVYYLPPAPAAAPESGPAAAQGPADQDQVSSAAAALQSSSLAEQLRTTLEGQGWRAERAPDGSLYYLPPRLDAAPVTPAESPAAPEAPVLAAPSPAEQLREALGSQGWSAVPADDGSVYYLPPEPPATRQPTLAERLRQSLEQQGWVPYTAEDGSVIYRAPAAAAPEADPPALRVTPAVPDQPQQPPGDTGGAQGTGDGGVGQPEPEARSGPVPRDQPPLSTRAAPATAAEQVGDPARGGGATPEPTAGAPGQDASALPAARSVSSRHPAYYRGPRYRGWPQAAPGPGAPGAYWPPAPGWQGRPWGPPPGGYRPYR